MTNRSRNDRYFRAAAFAVVAALAVGCGSTGHARRVAADQRIAVLVGERFAASPELSNANVVAKSYAGVVALLGEAPDENVMREAEREAASVPGVVRVNNMMLVVKGASRTAGSAPAKGALVIARAD
jgi:osmotically-inducible protein OsmY